MLVFFSMVSLIFSFGHYYIFSKIQSYLTPSEGVSSVLSLVLMLLCLGAILSFPLMRSLPQKQATIFAWVIYTWMGMLMLFVLSFLASDILLLIMQAAALFDAKFQIEQVDIKKVTGFVILIVITLATIFSIYKARAAMQVKEVVVQIAGMDKELSGFKIAQLTDLHVGPTIKGDFLRKVVAKTNALDADVVVITGDLVDGSVEQLHEHVAELKNLKAKYGVYFVTGNHEYYSGANEWMNYLDSIGIKVLRNELITVNHNGQNIHFAGVHDYHSGQHNMKLALVNREETTPVILLAHQPAAVEEAAQLGVDLQISGHTHGGQIWPWKYAVLLQQPYVEGLHRHKNGKTQVYISTGTGYWGPPMRLGTSAEISQIMLVTDLK